MMEAWELASYVVTVVGLPVAILIFVYQARRERANEEEEEYQLLNEQEGTSRGTDHQM